MVYGLWSFLIIQRLIFQVSLFDEIEGFRPFSGSKGKSPKSPWSMVHGLSPIFKTEGKGKVSGSR